MSDPLDMKFIYDPKPATVGEPKPMGVEQGWVVIWDGESGPAHVAKAGMIHDGEGGMDVVTTEDFTECNVIDDS